MPRPDMSDKRPQNIRGAILSAFEDATGIVRERGKPLKVLIADKLEEDPLRVLAAIARLLPPERAPTGPSLQLNVAELHLDALRAAAVQPVQIVENVAQTRHLPPKMPSEKVSD